MANEKLTSAIMAAVGAHAMWKARLKSAIATGHVEPPAEIIALDNRCDFGKWLYGGDIDTSAKGSEYYERVRALHAQFHQQASRVAGEVLAGNLDKAIGLMNPEGDYSKISDELTKVMLAWKNT
jgi:hypothetical protein